MFLLKKEYLNKNSTYFLKRAKLEKLKVKWKGILKNILEVYNTIFQIDDVNILKKIIPAWFIILQGYLVIGVVLFIG